MSIRVELDRLLEVAGGFGTVPMLLTVDADGRARAAAVGVTWDGEIAAVRAGRRSVANAGERALVSLLYPAPPGEKFALLVDGEVTAVEAEVDADGEPSRDGGTVTMRATGAILHVVASDH